MNGVLTNVSANFQELYRSPIQLDSFDFSYITSNRTPLSNQANYAESVESVVTTSAGGHFPVTGVIASDELLDITFLKIDANDLNPIAIGDSDAVQVGDETLVIGHAEGFINTLSVGNIAGFRGYESQGMGTNIQIEVI